MAASNSDPSPGVLTILGHRVQHPVDHVECFAAPDGVVTVRATSDELTSMCPVTGQPDISRVSIEYEPGQWCMESKSLKLYLWRFRDRPAFAEALAAEIADEIMTTASPKSVRVHLTQQPRGGITIEAIAQRP